jgi:hypothetical protein
MVSAYLQQDLLRDFFGGPQPPNQACCTGLLLSHCGSGKIESLAVKENNVICGMSQIEASGFIFTPGPSQREQ